MKNIAVVGLGNIGLRTLWRLNKLGYKAVGLDSSSLSVKKAMELGLKAILGDASNPSAISDAMGFNVDVVVTALPGSMAYEIVKGILNHGYNMVDVSFFPQDPLELREIVRGKNSTVVIDTGIAPGYSNFLIGRAIRVIKATKAHIYVGGLSGEPHPPLGIAATWSTYDLLEEYIRPARLIVDGKTVSINPLEAGISYLDFPGTGRLEAFPTDGLRTLLYSYPYMSELAEYTLRRPGHIDFIKSLAKLGFLEDSPLKLTGCTISPRECLARMIEKGVSNIADVVVMSVEAEGEDGLYRAFLKVKPENDWSAMARATAAFQVAVTRLLVEHGLPKGLLFPENLGENASLAGILETYLNEEELTPLEAWS
ncbi:MAG: NAD-binding protein [Desulfurococcales archaeon]|nr:NAD-binding protein [Desulfurococcales archaeon]